MPIPGLAIILEHCQPGADPEPERIVRELKWWADVNDSDVGYYPGVYGDRGIVFVWRREKVLQLAAALPISPECIAACDQMASTLEEFIALLAAAVSVPAATVRVTLPSNLTGDILRQMKPLPNFMSEGRGDQEQKERP